MSQALIAQANDQNLMVLVQDGDTAAFAELYDRYAGRAFRVAHSVCGDYGQAEDAVQEGFLELWRCRSGYRAELGTFSAWSLRIVRNRAIDSHRSAASKRETGVGRELDEISDSTHPGPEEGVIEGTRRNDLRSSLRQLPDAQAKVIALAFYGELSHAEIASELGLPPGTVKGRMRLGLEKLRRSVEADCTANSVRSD